MTRQLIFIGGIHGVGKTFLCEILCERYNMMHVSASALIKKHVVFSKEKHVDDIEYNQQVLAVELQKLEFNKLMVLLDGHFTLINTAGEVSDVPYKTFDIISPSSIIVLVKDVKEIARQVYNRDGRIIEEAFLSRHQAREVSYACEVGQILGVPVLEIGVEKCFESTISQIWNIIGVQK
jgi:adenylate kinase